MRTLTPASLALMIGTGLLAGCGGGSSNTTPSMTAADAQSTAGASASVGFAAEAGLNQLYSGGSIAMVEPGCSGTLSDGRGPLNQVIYDTTVAPPMPFAGTAVITTSSYVSPNFISGHLIFEADTTGLPSGWFHVSLTFDPTNPFVVQDEEGDTATISTGSFDLYVLDQLTGNDGIGDWNRTVDAYQTIAMNAPISVTVQLHSGGTRVDSLYGIRHENRIIARTQTTAATPIVTRIDNVTVDGDASGVPISPVLTDGSTLLDRNGHPEVFSRWMHTNNDPATGVWNTFLWERYCTYTITYVHAAGAPLGMGTASNWFENIYIQKDSQPLIGPLGDLQLISRFGLVYDLTQLAANF